MDPSSDESASQLLRILKGSDYNGLYQRFSSFLIPFGDFVDLDAHAPTKNKKKTGRKAATTTTTRRKKEKGTANDSILVRPLAKKFLPFLSGVLKILHTLPLKCPRRGGDGGEPGPGREEEVEGNTLEIFGVYRLALDCLSCISPCLAGKPYSVHLQKSLLVSCLEAWGLYDQANEEGYSLLSSLVSVIASTALNRKTERRKAAGGSHLLPDPVVNDPELAITVVEVVTSLIRSTFKRETKDQVAYERVLSLVHEVQPWLRLLNSDVFEKYQTSFVTALYKCALFLAGSSMSFSSDLLRDFCTTTLQECLKSPLKDQYPKIARRICASLSLQSGDRSPLILDMLRYALEAIFCQCKVDVVYIVNEFLEIVSYCAENCHVASTDISGVASKLLYEHSGNLLQVSRPTSSILSLYAAGLYSKSGDIQASHMENIASSNDASAVTLLLQSGVDLQLLVDSLDSLERYFCVSSHSRVLPNPADSEDGSYMDLQLKTSGACKCKHGEVSLLSYLDAFEFLCTHLEKYVNTTWEYMVSETKSFNFSGQITYVWDALTQFCNMILTKFSYTSEEERMRLRQCLRTMLHAAVAALRIALGTSRELQKTLTYINHLISSEWVESPDLKFLVSSFYNTGASLYNIRQMEQASVAFQLCCATVWEHVKLLCQKVPNKSKGVHDDIASEAAVNESVSYACEKTAVIVDILHQCGNTSIQEIIVKSLLSWSSAGDLITKLISPMSLVRQWVKIVCKDFEVVDAVDKIPDLYSLLMSYCTTWSKKTLGIILEQELLAYEKVGTRYPGLSQKMQLKIIESLLDVYTKDYFLQRSKVLVRKGRALRSRTCGLDAVNSCVQCLSEAISILNEANQNDESCDDIRNKALLHHQLAVTYYLHAQCACEANQNIEVVMHDIRCAINLWSGNNFLDYCSMDDRLEFLTENTMQLLCNIADLLSVKGNLQFQYDICKLIITLCKQKNIKLEKCMAMLWNDRRLKHALCALPIDEALIVEVSQHICIHVNSVDFWINCMKSSPPCLLSFLQKFMLSDHILPQASIYNSESYDSKVTVEAVKKVASSLISHVPLVDHSALTAGCLYYDLAERLFANGRLFQALFFGIEALQLRRRIFHRKFRINSEKPLVKVECGDRGTTSSNSDHSCLEDSVITPWMVLRCYLESTLQVGVIHESIGNGTEAEKLLQTGKRISCLCDLPFLSATFASYLGQVYRKKQLWDLAKGELDNAKTLLDNSMTISCHHCKLSLEVTIDMQIADISRSLFECGSGNKSVKLLSRALDLYKFSLEKLKLAEQENILRICDKTEAASISSTSVQNEAEDGVHTISGVASTWKEVRLIVCSNCDLSGCNVGYHGDGSNQSGSGFLSRPKIEQESSLVNIGVSKKSKIVSEHIPSKQTLNAELNVRRTRSRNRSASSGTVNVAGKLDCGFPKYACTDSSEKEDAHMGVIGKCLSDSGCDEASAFNRTNCWRCIVLKVMEAGTMRDVICLKWACHRRRLLLRLLSGIAKCKVIQCSRHEVHEIFWQSISVLYNRKPFCQTSGMPYPRLLELIEEEDLGDMFSIERAVILYNLSWFSIKNSFVENSWTGCCCLSNIQIKSVLCWLLRAFILAREMPLLFQKVSRLLAAIFLLSTLDGLFSLPLWFAKSLSVNYWAAYFHQASIGGYWHHQHFADVKEKASSTELLEGLKNTGLAEKTFEASSFLRYVPETLANLEDYVRGFFLALPSLTVICVSLLGGDYANLFGETLGPSFFPAWMLLSRLNSNGQPIVMLLPIAFVSKEIQKDKANSVDDANSLDETKCLGEETKRWECPWSYTTLDYVAPQFKQILEENYLSLSSVTSSLADTQRELSMWWSQRTKLNNRLSKFLRNTEESWFGPWRCLLLGEHLKLEHFDTVISNLICNLRCKCQFETNRNILKAILGGSQSMSEAEACVSQLLMYKGYVGRGEGCGEENFRAFSTECSAGVESTSKLIRQLILDAFGELVVEPVDREPIVLVFDADVQMLPWENLPILRKQEVYRMPSLGSIFATLGRSCPHQDKVKAYGVAVPSIDPLDAFYVLNPSGDLSNTQVEFEEWFKNQKWEGKTGEAPTMEELASALQNRDLFIYFGHGSGTQYMPERDIEKLDIRAATLLMGCSSGSLSLKGCYAPQGPPISYLYAGCPAVIATLWEVSDKDIDRFGKAVLGSWLQDEELASKVTCNCSRTTVKYLGFDIDEERNNTHFPRRSRRAPLGKKKVLQEGGGYDGSCRSCCKWKRIASPISQARDACKLPLLIGASPVCYGVPTYIRKKKS